MDSDSEDSDLPDTGSRPDYITDDWRAVERETNCNNGSLYLSLKPKFETMV